MSERYGAWTIEYDPKPIPVRKFDYSFWHDDYDGAEDSFDNRAGTAASVDEAKLEIDMIDDMERDLTPKEEALIDNGYRMLRLEEAARALGATSSLPCEIAEMKRNIAMRDARRPKAGRLAFDDRVLILRTKPLRVLALRVSPDWRGARHA